MAGVPAVKIVKFIYGDQSRNIVLYSGLTADATKSLLLSSFSRYTPANQQLVGIKDASSARGRVLTLQEAVANVAEVPAVVQLVFQDSRATRARWDEAPAVRPQAEVLVSLRDSEGNEHRVGLPSAGVQPHAFQRVLETLFPSLHGRVIAFDLFQSAGAGASAFPRSLSFASACRDPSLFQRAAGSRETAVPVWTLVVGDEDSDDEREIARAPVDAQEEDGEVLESDEQPERSFRGQDFLMTESEFLAVRSLLAKEDARVRAALRLYPEMETVVALFLRLARAHTGWRPPGALAPAPPVAAAAPSRQQLRDQLVARASTSARSAAPAPPVAAPVEEADHKDDHENEDEADGYLNEELKQQLEELRARRDFLARKLEGHSRELEEKMRMRVELLQEIEEKSALRDRLQEQIDGKGEDIGQGDEEESDGEGDEDSLGPVLQLMEQRGLISAAQKEALLDKAAAHDPVVLAALVAFEVNHDAADLADTLLHVVRQGSARQGLVAAPDERSIAIASRQAAASGPAARSSATRDPPDSESREEPRTTAPSNRNGAAAFQLPGSVPSSQSQERNRAAAEAQDSASEAEEGDELENSVDLGLGSADEEDAEDARLFFLSEGKDAKAASKPATSLERTSELVSAVKKVSLNKGLSEANAARLEKLAKEQDTVLLSAFNLFSEDSNWTEFSDTVVRRLAADAAPKISNGDAKSSLVSAATDGLPEDMRQTLLMLSVLLTSGVLDDLTAALAWRRVRDNDEKLIAAFQRCRQDNDFAGLVETILTSIAPDVEAAKKLFDKESARDQEAKAFNAMVQKMESKKLVTAPEAAELRRLFAEKDDLLLSALSVYDSKDEAELHDTLRILAVHSRAGMLAPDDGDEEEDGEDGTDE